VELRDSPIAGRGLFAAADLAAGTVVVRLGRLARAEPVGDLRVDELGAGFPNHSCDPVLGWRNADLLVTMVEVPAGSELVTDYAMRIADPRWLLRCHCPSYRCRQMVEGTDWRIPLLQRRYDGWWSPAVRRLIEQTGSA
jgi:hypothetical protein